MSNLEIRVEKDGDSLILMLTGRLDTRTAPLLEDKIEREADQITHLTLDLEQLEYVSSAGLRVILMAQKLMNKQGDMLVKNVNEEIMEVFSITGFSDILDIE